jgi:DHA1 family multidrug resistance protein-like MFS transporter
MKSPPALVPGLKTLQTAMFFVAQPFFIMDLLLPIYGKDMGANAVEIGLIFSAFSIMTIVMRPVVGWALDRFGRRPFFVVGMLTYALTMVAFAFSEQVWGMVAARFLQGAASTCAVLSANAIIADITTESNRARAFGGLVQASSRGSIVGALIAFTLYNAPPLVERVGEAHIKELLFLAFAGFALVAFVIALTRLSETRRRLPNAPRRPIQWSRAWFLLLLVTLVTAAAWSRTSPILILFLQDKLHLGIDVIAWAFLPSGLIWATLPSRLGRLADRFGRKPLMILGLAVSALTMFILPALTNIFGLAALWSVLALCFAAGDPAEQALVAELTGSDQHGQAYGYYVMAADIGAALGPLGGGWLYDNLNASAPFFATGVILGVCGLVLFFFLRLPQRVPVEDKP